MSEAKIFSKKNKVILKELIKTDFKLRYQGSILGYVWAVLKPLLMFAILYVVFVQFLRFGDDIPHYAVYLLTGIVLWSFFTEATSQGMQSIVARGSLMRKINFPKSIVVISATMSSLINLAINLCVVIIFALINGVVPSISWLMVPLLIIELYVLALGIAFLLGAINVKFKDISSIWDVIIQAMFYAVPIIYPLSMVASASPVFAKILLVNPIAQVIQDVRFNLITNEAATTWNYIDNPWIALIPIAIVIGVFSFGIFYFSKRSKYFAEEA